MKNGYYLSVYSEVDPVANMLQISQRHDHNMALWYKEAKRVTLLRHWELERFTGFKQHSIAFFSGMITWALFRKGLRNMGCHWLISSRSLETPVRVSDQHVWPPYISIRIFLTMRFFICTPLFYRIPNCFTTKR